MGNIGSETHSKSDSSQIISYEEYLERRPKSTKASSASMIGDHSNKSIMHNIYYINQANSDKLHDYLNM